MSWAAWWFDGVLVGSLVVLAWGSVSARDPFTGIVRYIAFGLLAALTWARLEAPDLALAEAAIGAGLTGALLLSTLGRMGLRRASRHAGEALAPLPPRYPARRHFSLSLPVLVFLLAASSAVLIGAEVISLGITRSPGLGAAVSDLQLRSGIESDVAAVLLDFRGYDTLLEMSVLLTAVLAVWCLGVIRFRRPPWPVDPVLSSLARILAPFLLLVAAWLLQAGLHGPGGGFQAGAILGAAGVLWTLADRRALRLGERRSARLGLVLGLGTFAVGAFLPTLAGRPLLTWAPGTAPAWAWGIELAIAVSVGLTLTALFMGGLAEVPETEREEP
jgi:multisubunit Na+/H+ antiporter MnhB subunit